MTPRIKIETYWNVNSIGLVRFTLSDGIKIETYWNVNTQEKPVLEEPKD